MVCVIGARDHHTERQADEVDETEICIQATVFRAVEGELDETPVRVVVRIGVV